MKNNKISDSLYKKNYLMIINGIKIILLFNFIIINSSFSQTKHFNNTIKGRIYDQAAKNPVPYAVVFLQNTTIGNSADSAGFFEIKNIPPGQYDIIYSQAAYEAYSERIRLKDSSTIIRNIYLKLKVFSLKDVEIVARSSDEWKKNIEIFRREFIGLTLNTEKCKILNPEVINFYADSWNSTFSASTDSILTIENRALGYNIRLCLKRFIINTKDNLFSYHYYPKYEELIPAKKEELYLWKEKRASCYRGSLLHFIRSLIKRELIDEGFMLFGSDNSGGSENKIGKSILPDSIRIKPLGDSTFYEINFGFPCIQVTYMAGANDYNHTNKLISLIESPDDIFIVSKNGAIIQPVNIIKSGHWSRLRLADLLPVNYEYGD